MTLEILPAKPHALLFQALANPARMQILNLLREKGRMNVTQICGELGMEQTRVSHSLRCLAFCGLVNSSREGKSRIYSVNDETTLPLLKAADEHLRRYATNLLTCDSLER
ncbi:MAG: helix-turn-helix transcriptional regulator [Nitrososphaerota archaeon]|nr:helix-turn-helix transcriptional regulator [Nitrososphaerota archaeon]MDG6916265.1 helix-turn-helix transcriptional regulator [Nitrososphaerota archaeon]MDG6918673.1 helix-turn-helix transcriptional regulator [Nitrososphaerota archaeon]MDG6946706.1 helix-turn-helix transcriptional regulator [Nitrososphaerota archaeon]